MGKCNFVSSIRDGELLEGKMRSVRVKGRPVMLVRVGGGVYGVSDVCPHAGCSFRGGILTGYVLMCPCHGWKFDVRNGGFLDNVQIGLVSYECRVEGGRVWVKLEK